MPAAVQPLVPTIALTAAAVTLYTVPVSPQNMRTLVTSILIANTDSAARLVYIYNVAPGDTAAVGNTIWPATSIPANTCWLAVDGGSDQSSIVTMPAGGSLAAKADVANKVTLTVAGKEIT